jgi:hypothetical protein
MDDEKKGLFFQRFSLWRMMPMTIPLHSRFPIWIRLRRSIAGAASDNQASLSGSNEF